MVIINQMGLPSSRDRCPIESIYFAPASLVSYHNLSSSAILRNLSTPGLKAPSAGWPIQDKIGLILGHTPYSFNSSVRCNIQYKKAEAALT